MWSQIREFFSYQSVIMEKSDAMAKSLKTSFIARTKYWRRRKQVLPIALLAVTIALYGNSKIYYGKFKRSLTERPIMHTFFDSNEESDVAILTLWDEEWTRNGFTTKILTLDDSKSHPDFEEMKKNIETNGSGDETKSFYKWLAMSASDGGWFSSFETFPTKSPFSEGKDLLHGGALTLFQGNIPSMVSGEVEEWDRVTKLLLDAIPRIEGKPITDVSALEVLQNEDNQGINFLYPPDNVHVGFMYVSPREVNCEIMSKVRAINFTPKSVQDAMVNNLYPVEISREDMTGFKQRKEAFSIFLNDWKSQCKSNISGEGVMSKSELHENKLQDGDNLQENNIQENEIQQSEIQQSEIQQSEIQQSEIQQSEIQQSEIQQNGIQQSEIQQNEIQGNEIQGNEIQQNEIQQNEIQQSEIQQSEIQQNEIQQNEIQGNIGMDNEHHEVVGTQIDFQENMATENDRVEPIGIGGNRPVMHTFFHPSPHDRNEIDENKQLKLWKEEWGRIGFDTVILTLDNAKKNPIFEELVGILEPLYGSTGYQALCFYRWLAMASCGGGWLSDYDILPTNFPIIEGSVLPIHGKFISYQSFVPSLMSANEQEWNRVSKLLIDAIPRIADLPGDTNHPITDMFAFNVLRIEGNHGILFVPFTIGVQDGYIYSSSREVNCEKMSIGRAVHMSPAPTDKAILQGVYPTEVVSDDPHGLKTRNEAEGAEIFMNDWRSQCSAVLSTPRPIMHTFFSSSLPTDVAVLQLWKEKWTTAGFDPVVLTIDDTMKHPHFEEVEKKIALLYSKTGHDASYFYRWLAMAVSGGGWISDYDTFPITFPVEAGLNLPNEGKFTLFQSDIPSLMSGSEGEWNRVSSFITNLITKIEENFNKDLHAFIVLRKEHDGDIIFSEDLFGKLILHGFTYIKDEGRKVDCAAIDQMAAVRMDHFALHTSVLDGSYPIEIKENDPNRSGDAEAFRVFFADVKAQCSLNELEAIK